METVRFDIKKTKETFSYSWKPVINLIKVEFLSDDKNWISRLFEASFFVTIMALDGANKVLASHQMPLSLGAYITPNHKQPTIELNKTFKFPTDSFYQRNVNNAVAWKIEIELHGINFLDNESVVLSYMDSKYINKRIDDWQNRVHNLILNLTEWTHARPDIEIKLARKQNMHEEMMKNFNVPMREIESADILLNGKIVVAIKPFGLWIMGANGRIDLLTAGGNFILVDEAEHFTTPKWKLYLKNDKGSGIEFNRENYLHFIEK